MGTVTKLTSKLKEHIHQKTEKMGSGSGEGQGSGGDETRNLVALIAALFFPPSPSSSWTGAAAPCSSTSPSAFLAFSPASSMPSTLFSRIDQINHILFCIA